MATRFYLESSGVGSVSPAFAGGWENTASADVIAMGPTRGVTTMTSKSVAHTGTTNDDVLWRQFVSAPMNSGLVFTTGDSLKVQVRGKEIAAANNYFLCLALRIFSQDGLTSRSNSKLLFGTTITEFGTSLINRQLATTLAATYTTVSGDRLVLELGFRSNAASQTDVCGGSFGSDSATDLGENGTDTNPFNPWMETVTDITFLAGGGSGAGTSTKLRSLRRRRR